MIVKHGTYSINCYIFLRLPIALRIIILKDRTFNQFDHHRTITFVTTSSLNTNFSFNLVTMLQRWWSKDCLNNY